MRRSTPTSAGTCHGRTFRSHEEALPPEAGDGAPREVLADEDVSGRDERGGEGDER